MMIMMVMMIVLSVKNTTMKQRYYQ